MRYHDFVQRQKAKHGDMFSEENLNRNFISAYNNGDTFRVLVDLGYDKPVWGYIGVTTGWKPCFLLMRRRGQHGSSDTINKECKILKTKWIK
jgi:hypothetical protein